MTPNFQSLERGTEKRLLLQGMCKGMTLFEGRQVEWCLYADYSNMEYMEIGNPKNEKIILTCY
jgi:hypothetical protein